jgi:hypothetical protein
VGKAIEEWIHIAGARYDSLHGSHRKIQMISPDVDHQQPLGNSNQASSCVNQMVGKLPSIADAISLRCSASFQTLFLFSNANDK